MAIDPQLRPTWILCQLHLRGTSAAEVARAHKVSRAAVSAAILGPVSERLDGVLADALGMTPQELYPERYDAQGGRISRRGNSGYAIPKAITAGQIGHANRVEAA